MIWFSSQMHTTNCMFAISPKNYEVTSSDPERMKTKFTIWFPSSSHTPRQKNRELQSIKWINWCFILKYVYTKQEPEGSQSICCSRKWKSDLWRSNGGGSTSDRLTSRNERDISSIEKGMLPISEFILVTWLRMY